MPIRQIWSHQGRFPLLGLSLAREAGLLLAWDAGQRLTLWDLQGRPRAREVLLQPVVAAAVSDDGAWIVALGPQGQLRWFDGSLRFHFDLELQLEPLALALEPLGECVAVSDRRRRTVVVRRQGQNVATIETPRPLAHLTFLSVRPVLVGAADYGYVAAFDAAGRTLWQDGPVSHIGSLATDEAGDTLLLACYSQGIQRYDRAGSPGRAVATAAPCRAVRCSADGLHWLAADERGGLSLLNPAGTVLDCWPLPAPPCAVQLGALGEVGAFGLPGGLVGLLNLLP